MKSLSLVQLLALTISLTNPAQAVWLNTTDPSSAIQHAASHTLYDLSSRVSAGSSIFPSGSLPSDFSGLPSGPLPSDFPEHHASGVSGLPSQHPSGFPSGTSPSGFSGLPSGPFSSQAPSTYPSVYTHGVSGSVKPSEYQSGSVRPFEYQYGSVRSSEYQAGSVRPSQYQSGSLRSSGYPSGSTLYHDAPASAISSGSFKPSAFPSGSVRPSGSASGSARPSAYPSGSALYHDISGSLVPFGSFKPSANPLSSVRPSAYKSGSSIPSVVPSNFFFSHHASGSVVPSGSIRSAIPSGSVRPTVAPSGSAFYHGVSASVAPSAFALSGSVKSSRYSSYIPTSAGSDEYITVTAAYTTDLVGTITVSCSFSVCTDKDSTSVVTEKDKAITNVLTVPVSALSDAGTDETITLTTVYTTDYSMTLTVPCSSAVCTDKSTASVQTQAKTVTQTVEIPLTAVPSDAALAASARSVGSKSASAFYHGYSGVSTSGNVFSYNNLTGSYLSYTTFTRTHQTIHVATISLTDDEGNPISSLQTSTAQTTEAYTLPVNSNGQAVVLQALLKHRPFKLLMLSLYLLTPMVKLFLPDLLSTLNLVLCLTIPTTPLTLPPKPT
ncbi:unnamed protein product [Ambrosiozyma monospora]|uniref:Unnamed protein product n=1 Tax=Ambrosiozyma monospora TaxID=43982 RepID=A0ACB5TAA5_AMBMO|nr:unnamed protein product [Ambrosiozyma monospora]